MKCNGNYLPCKKHIEIMGARSNSTKNNVDLILITFTIYIPLMDF